jgi:signal transduction histidine kinase/DNA-binding response OmpR family regulator
MYRLSHGKYLYLIVFVVGMLISTMFSIEIYKSTAINNREAFERIAAKNISLIENAIVTHVQMLEDIGNFFLSSKYVEPGEFHTFTSPFLKRNDNYEIIAWVTPTANDYNIPLYAISSSTPWKSNGSDAGLEIADYPAFNSMLQQATKSKNRVSFFNNLSVFKDNSHNHFSNGSRTILVHPVYMDENNSELLGFSIGIINIGKIAEMAVGAGGLVPYNYVTMDLIHNNELDMRIYETKEKGVPSDFYNVSNLVKLDEEMALRLNFLPTEPFLKSHLNYYPYILFTALSVLTLLASYYMQQMSLNMRELREAQLRAEEANRLKNEFLATMSHEIRSPMSGVLGMAELLMQTRQTPEQHGYTKTIINSGETLLNIIEDILDFSKIEADKVVLDPIPTNMLQLVDDVCALYAPKAREKALELAVRYVPGSEQFVYADPVRVRQVLSNLINNAIKFTEKGYVVVSVREDKSNPHQDKVNLIFSVEDSGIGIAPEAHEKIFEKFVQADSSTTRDFGGTGLGLSICERLVEMMGGKIVLQSEPGKGSTFTFNLPLTRNAKETQAPIRPPVLKDVKVLIVDDLPVIHTLMTEQLTFAGMRCACAFSGEEALETMREAAAMGDPYKMVIIDYLLPGMNGEMVARAISDEPAFANTCLIMLTSAGTPAMTSESLARKGFSSYIAKPVTAYILIETLAVVWSKYRGGQTDSLIHVDTYGLGQEIKEPSVRLDGIKILLAEDSRINQAFAQDVLEQLGCTITIASNGKEALKAVDNEDFDLVLMDCQMPVMDGFEATRKICDLKKAGSIRADLPVIALTANAMKGDRQRCLDAGMDDYISKPVRTNDLREKVFSWVTNRKPLPYVEEHVELTAPSSSPSTNAVLDLAAVVESHAVLKDKYASILSYYIEDVTGYMEEIKTALETGIIKGAVRPAHTIKSASRRMGAITLSDLAKDMEQAANDENCPPEMLKEKLSDMTAVFETTRAALLQESRRKTG